MGLRHVGLEPVLAIYDEGAERAIRATLERCRGVLVWVDPISVQGDRAGLNELLAELATPGRWISAHPETIAAIGTKRVLVDCQDMTWGVESAERATIEELGDALHAALAAGSTRVLKPLRGNGGRAVWKVAPGPEGGTVAYVQEAHVRDDRIERLALDEFVARIAPAFEGGGTVIDQAFVDSARMGMTRAYVSVDRVIGFCTQSPAVSAQRAAPYADPVFSMASAKEMFEASDERFGGLRRDLEEDWIPELRRRFRLSEDDLPALWDLDFLHAPSGVGHVLCEINVSCVSPFPDAAPAAVAACAASRSR